MGHSHGKKWTEKKIIKEIKDVMKALNIERMPSHSEINKITGGYGLTNQISKKGGTNEWAEKLGLNLKSSGTSKGEEYEQKIAKKIKSMGYDVEILGHRAPYDLFVEGCVKVEVKSSNGFQDSFFTFNLYKEGMTKSDIIVFIGENENLKNKTLVMPSHFINGLTQLNLYRTSDYDKYIDKWDYIEKLVNFYNKL